MNKNNKVISMLSILMICFLVITLFPGNAIAKDNNTAMPYVQNRQVSKAICNKPATNCNKPATNCNKPATIKIRSVKLSQDKKKVTIKWYRSKSKANTHTYIYRKVACGEWKCIAKLKANGTSFVDKKPIRGKSYYRVRGYNSSSKKCGNYSSCKMINIKHTHKFKSWVVKKKATCTENGYKTRICKFCDFSQNMTIKKLGHNMKAKKIVIGIYVCNCCNAQFANENDIGIHVLTVCGGGYSAKNIYDENAKEYYCTRCDFVKPGPKLEHKFSDWHLVANPTCVLDGEKARFCYRCKKRESIILPKLDRKHEFELAAEHPDLGYATYKCKHCGETEFRYL